MGKNTIGQILTNARKRFGFTGKKVSNHTVRKTGLGRLLDADTPEVFVAQHAGMANTDSLKSYKSAGKIQISNMSRILSGGKSLDSDSKNNEDEGQSSVQTNVLNTQSWTPK